MEDDPVDSLISSPLQHSSSTSENAESTASSSATAASTPITSLSSTSMSGNSATARNVDSGEEDDPLCRICLDGEDDTGELGRLLVPCKCSGTARHVHQVCLNSWRAADMKNGFYACTTCGARYRFRKTGWTRIASHPHSAAYLTYLLIVVFSILAGFAADPIMTATEEGRLKLDIQQWRQNFLDRSTPLLSASLRRVLVLPTHLLHTSLSVGHNNTTSLSPGSYLLPNFDTAGNALREAVSLSGFLSADCRWAASHELGRRKVEVSPSQPGEVQIESVVVEKRLELSRCGRVWGLERDDQRPALFVRVLSHLEKGVLTASLGTALYYQLFMKWLWICLAIPFLRRFDPIAGDPARFPYVLAISSHLVLCAMEICCSSARRARANDRLFSIWQLAFALAVLPTLLGAYNKAREETEKLIKRRVAGVENVVLDIRDDVQEGKVV